MFPVLSISCRSVQPRSSRDGRMVTRQHLSDCSWEEEGDRPPLQFQCQCPFRIKSTQSPSLLRGICILSPGHC